MFKQDLLRPDGLVVVLHSQYLADVAGKHIVGFPVEVAQHLSDQAICVVVLTVLEQHLVHS